MQCFVAKFDNLRVKNILYFNIPCELSYIIGQFLSNSLLNERVEAHGVELEFGFDVSRHILYVIVSSKCHVS